jgi:hypothetical protein
MNDFERFHKNSLRLARWMIFIWLAVWVVGMSVLGVVLWIAYLAVQKL